MPSNTSKTRMIRKQKKRAHKANLKADNKRMARNRVIISKE